MRSVVEVITTRTPAACRRRATAKPIPSALPAPVITAVCLFNGRATNLPARRNHTWFGKDCDSSELVRFLAVAELRRMPEWTVGELGQPSRGMVVADASEAYAFSVVRKAVSL